MLDLGDPRLVGRLGALVAHHDDHIVEIQGMRERPVDQDSILKPRGPPRSDDRTCARFGKLFVEDTNQGFVASAKRDAQPVKQTLFRDGRGIERHIVPLQAC